MGSALTYFNSFDPAEQARIRQSWGGQDRMGEWFQNAVNAGAVGADGTVGSRVGSFGGSYGGQMGDGYSQNVSGTSGLAAGQIPSPRQLRQYAREAGWSEDFDRFSDAQIQQWITNSWDPQAMKFKSEADGSLVEKPTEVPQGWEAFGQGYRQIPAGGGGGAGGGYGSGSSTWGTGLPGAGSAPGYSFQQFQAPNLVDDPGYQFRLKEGQNAIERAAAARGVSGTGGTLKDLIDYSQNFASGEYGNAWNRAMGGWSGNLGAGQFEWNTRYQPWSQQFNASENRWQTQQNNDLARWQTQFGGNLQRDLQREGHIFGLLGGGAPTMPGYQSF